VPARSGADGGALRPARARLRAWRARALLALTLAMAGAPALAFDLPELMQLLGQRRSGETRFTEERFVSGLDQTLQSSGVLRFQAPDRFEQRVEQPRPSSMLVEGNQVTLVRGDRRRQLSLDSVPELAAMVAAIRGTLTGDASALHSHFRVDVDGAATLWTLTLTPLDAQLAGTVRWLRIVGQRADLRSMELQLADGDRSLMQIDPPKAPGPATRAAAPAAASSSARPASTP